MTKNIIKLLFIVIIVAMLLFSSFLGILYIATIPLVDHTAKSMDDRVIEVYESESKKNWDQFRFDVSSWYSENKLRITLFWGILNALLFAFFAFYRFEKPYLMLTSYSALWTLVPITNHLWTWNPTVKAGFIIWVLGKIIEAALIVWVISESNGVLIILRKIKIFIKSLITTNS